MACMRNDGSQVCPNCGRRRRYNPYGAARRRPEGAPFGPDAAPGGDRVCTGTAAAAADAADCSLTPAQELYGASCNGTLLRSCCDLYGCREYPAGQRDSFWPSFARPRWLPCEVLYRRR